MLENIPADLFPTVVSYLDDPEKLKFRLINKYLKAQFPRFYLQSFYRDTMVPDQFHRNIRMLFSYGSNDTEKLADFKLVSTFSCVMSSIIGIPDWRYLTALDVSSSNITELPPTLVNLKRLKVSYTRLTDLSSTYINLKFLCVSGTKISQIHETYRNLVTLYAMGMTHQLEVPEAVRLRLEHYFHS